VDPVSLVFQGEQCLSLSRVPAEHSVTWVTLAQINGRDGTVLRRGSSAVDKYNEFSALLCPYVKFGAGMRQGFS